MSGRVVAIAVDASDNAKHAVEYYLEEIHRPTDQVVLVHIPEMPDLPAFSFSAGISFPAEQWTAALQTVNQKIKQIEDAYYALLTPKKVQYRLKSEQCKSPGQGIIQTAEAEKASLIIMGTRGLDRLRRTLLGSVSDYVVRHSKVPVLVCPLNS